MSFLLVHFSVLFMTAVATSVNGNVVEVILPDFSFSITFF